MGAWGTDTFANDHAMDWIAELVANARAAINSAFAELRDLWAESEEFETWRAALTDLKGRLA